MSAVVKLMKKKRKRKEEIQQVVGRMYGIIILGRGE